MWLDFLRWAHVIGACVLLGTGAGIAFFMLMAHQTRNPVIIAHTARIVVFADWLFTASAVVLQPLTGVLLAVGLGWSLFEPWLAISIALYVFVGMFWMPVVWIQHKLMKLAEDALQSNSELPDSYYRMFRVWFICGIPAFTAVLVIVWLMLTRPVFG